MFMWWIKDKITDLSAETSIGCRGRSRNKLLATTLTRRCRNYFARCVIRTDQPVGGVLLKEETMKLPTILTTAAMVAGFVPFGQAVCDDGDIAVVWESGDRVRTLFQSADSPHIEMIRNGRSVRTTVGLSLLASLKIYVGNNMPMPMRHVKDRKCQCHLREIRPCSLWAYDSVDDVLEPHYLFDMARDQIEGLATLLL